MTADRFGPVPGGELTAMVAARRVAPIVADPGGSGMVGSPPPPLPAPPAPGPTAGGRRRAPSSRLARLVPPQHGAWAFLLVPVLSGFAVSGAGPSGWAFCAAWVCAYPMGYFLGRALTARARRGAWTRLARREAGRALPWAAAVAIPGIPLALSRPWLVPAAGLLAALWAGGLVVAARWGDRSLPNDLLLVAQSVAAVPLAVTVVAGPSAVTGELRASTVIVTVVVAVYLAGSVLHVKSLLREAGRPGYHRASVAWHAVALAGVLLVDPWWCVAFVPALVRSVALRPGVRPATVGGIEAALSVLVVVAAHLAA